MVSFDEIKKSNDNFLEKFGRENVEAGFIPECVKTDFSIAEKALKNVGTKVDALEIIDDSSSVVGDQIKISDVAPVKDGYVPSIGGYTVLIPLVPASEKEKYLKQADLDVEDELLDLDEFDSVAP